MPILVFQRDPLQQEGAAINHGQVVIREVPHTMQAMAVYVQILADSLLVTSLYRKFHCFTVHFDSLSFIHTNSYTFSYNHVLVF